MISDQVKTKGKIVVTYEALHSKGRKNNHKVLTPSLRMF